MTVHEQRVFIDSCAVNQFALINLDPAKALDGSGFVLSMTLSLAAEYRLALDHLFVPPHVKKLIATLLKRCDCLDGNSDEPTDRGLVAYGVGHVVITADAKLYRRFADGRPGLVAWPDVEAHLRADGRLADLIQARAARLLSVPRSLEA